MNQKEIPNIESIAKHVAILNSEVGKLQNDVKWVKYIIYYIGGILSVAFGKILFFS